MQILKSSNEYDFFFNGWTPSDFFCRKSYLIGDFWGDASGKETCANSGDIRDISLIPGLEHTLEEGMATH